ncbi:DNA-binding transcriptional regulator, Lrp family [Nakamurella panacisegetis]|uniref:DNA-binding transcriptional regulator, Lrp family n=1 Tax=Nakamurella panacisegetis TaxID=1090615 RepID=A0A1H0Q1F8_9ACTN|nr:Lrp/AsnC family transcriptional regulator [Nakamurella panacisegetis]SDP11203.1 DNA-binding transcriptional regulator, Lrp family [Nakamurella panacisegetis]
MSSIHSGRGRSGAGPSQNVRGAAGPPIRPSSPAAAGPPLDAIDRAILEVLAADARTPNNALAAAVGVAPSTALARVRALRAGGAIRGFHADIDPAVLGRPLQAMIAVRLQAGARSRMMAFTQRIRQLPEVLDIYFLAGADDFLLHVAAADAVGLRDFVVDQLSAYPEVALTETNLIFEHVRGTGPS